MAKKQSKVVKEEAAQTEIHFGNFFPYVIKTLAYIHNKIAAMQKSSDASTLTLLKELNSIKDELKVIRTSVK